MDLPDPDIQAGSWDWMRAGVQRNLDALAKASTGFGGKSVEIRFGTSVLTYTASTESALVNVNHGLGRTPASITCTPFNAPAAGNRPIISLGAVGATTFSAAGEVKTAFTGTVSFYWIAIG